MEDENRTGSVSETGSDNQMTPEQRTEVRRRLEFEQAAVVEEERKTAAQPVDNPG